MDSTKVKMQEVMHNKNRMIGSAERRSRGFLRERKS